MGEERREPVYSDESVNVYEVSSLDEAKKQLEAQWAREAEGESPEQASWRLRQYSVNRQDWPAIQCDQCHERPGSHHALVAGSAKGVLDFIDNKLGCEVPGRFALESVIERAGDMPGLGLSARVLVFCDDHGPSDRGDDAPAWIEPGYEELARRVFQT